MRNQIRFINLPCEELKLGSVVARSRGTYQAGSIELKNRIPQLPYGHLQPDEIRMKVGPSWLVWKQFQKQSDTRIRLEGEATTR